MKKAYSLILLSIVYCLLSIVYNAEAAVFVSSEELLKNSEQYDGKIIVYKGEVIGDIMLREKSAWVNVLDETAAIGVFCPQQLLGEIEYPGSYKFKGDIISVRGEFHLACPEHAGETDIHAEKIILIQKGEATAHPLEPKKVKAGIILAAAVFALAIIHLITRRFR